LIKLVKKLDKWIMASLPAPIENMFQLTHVIAHPLVDVLAQLPRPQRHHPRPPKRLRGRSQPPRLTVQHLRLDPLRRLRPRPNPQQHDNHPRQTIMVHGRFHDGLGRRQFPHSRSPQLHRRLTHPLLPRYRGSSLLSWCAVYAVDVLHQEGIGHEDQYSLLG